MAFRDIDLWDGYLGLQPLDSGAVRCAGGSGTEREGSYAPAVAIRKSSPQVAALASAMR